MPEPRQLVQVASRGLFELGEAAVEAPRNDLLRPLSRRAWGPLPGLSLGLLAVAAGLLGVVLGGLLPELPFVSHAAWPVLLLSGVAAWRIRRVLRTAHAEVGAAPARSFRALAIPLVPTAGVLALVAILAPHVLPGGWPGAVDALPDAGALELGWAFVLGWLARGAGVAVCTATLAGRRAWIGSVFEIGWRYFVFKILLWVGLLVAGLAGGILWSVLRQLVASLSPWRLPESWRAALDLALDHGIEVLVFLALIGGSWSVAERLFPRLLLSGDVHFLNRLSGTFGDEDEAPKETPDPTWPGVSAATPPPPPVSSPDGRWRDSC